jgi:hypothetical protein
MSQVDGPHTSDDLKSCVTFYLYLHVHHYISKTQVHTTHYNQACGMYDKQVERQICKTNRLTYTQEDATGLPGMPVQN